MRHLVLFLLASFAFGQIPNSATAGAPGVSSAIGLEQNAAYQMHKFRVAYAKTRDGVSDTKILFIGDSITAGNGSTLYGSYPTYGAYPSRITLGSNPVIQAKPSLGLFPGIADTRFTLGTGWSGYGGGYGFGAASAYLANGAAGTLVYTAGTQNGTSDTYTVYYYRFSGGGGFSAIATGGSSSGTISTNGADAVLSTTITASAANSTNTVTITNVSGQILILAIDASLSTRKNVRLANAGVVSTLASGGGSADWNSAASLLSINAYAPDLCFIALGTNDAFVAAATKATFKAAMQTLITNCQTSGSVVLVTPPPTSDGTVAALITQYIAALQELSVTNSVPILDIYGRWGSTFQTTLMNDAYHPNQVGYWDMGAAFSDFLQTVISFDPVTAISQIQDEGSDLTARPTVSFVGAGVTAADSGGKTVVTIPGGVSSGMFSAVTATAPSFSATPTFSLADVSAQSPVRIEPGVMTAAVTSVTFTNKSKGAKWSIRWKQDGTGGRALTHGASASGTCELAMSTALNAETTQFYEVGEDGTTVNGVGCIGTSGQQRDVETAAPGTPASGAFVCWYDSTNHIYSCKANNSATVSSSAVPLTCTNQVFSALSAAGVFTCRAVVSNDLNITATTCSAQFVRSISAGAVGTCASIVRADLPASTLTNTTNVTVVAPRQYHVCTSTCTVTVPAPAAGYEFCARNGNNVTTVITFAAIGSSAMYENTASTAYGTAGTGTLVSGGAAGDKICIVGLDSTHYQVWSYNGTWTVN